MFFEQAEGMRNATDSCARRMFQATRAISFFLRRAAAAALMICGAIGANVSRAQDTNSQNNNSPSAPRPTTPAGAQQQTGVQSGTGVNTSGQGAQGSGAASQNAGQQPGQPTTSGQTGQNPGEPTAGGQGTQSGAQGTQGGAPSGGAPSGTSATGVIGGAPSRANNASQAPGAARTTPNAPSTLSLEQVVQIAIQNNLTTLLANEREREARGFQRQALANLLPNISGSAYQANLTINLKAQGISFPFPGVPTLVGPFNNFDARVRLAQNIFNLAAIRSYEARKSGVRAAQLQEGLAREQVAQFAALAYLEALRARQEIAAAQANLDLAQQLLKLATDQRNAGVATGVDVARASVRVAQEQVRLAQAQTAAAQADLTLQRIVGLPQGVTLTLTDTLRFAQENFPSVENAIQTANQNRYEIRISEEQLRRLGLERRAINAENYPSLVFSGDYGVSGNTPTQNDIPTRRVQVQLNVPIFNGGLTRGREAVAASQQRQAELQLGDVRGQVENDVRIALQTLTTTAAQVRAAQDSLNLAQRELQLARDRFAAGVADNIEVVNAQTSLANAQDAVVVALAAYNAARLNLAAALGMTENFRF